MRNIRFVGFRVGSVHVNRLEFKELDEIEEGREHDDGKDITKPIASTCLNNIISLHQRNLIRSLP